MSVKKQKPIVEYIISGVWMLVMTLFFSLFAILFMLDVFPAWSRILIGILFVIPQVATHYLNGKKTGEKAFKRDKALSTEKNMRLPVPRYHRAIYHVLSFAIPLTVIFLLALILQNLTLRAAVIIVFFMPVTLIFWGMGAVNLDAVSWLNAAVYLPAILLYCGVFIYGYYIGVLRLRRREGAIKSELRSFNN